jgi:hypothetical protein
MGAQSPLKMLYIKPQKMDNVQNSVPKMNQLLSQTLTEPLTHNVSEVGYTSTFMWLITGQKWNLLEPPDQASVTNLPACTTPSFSN